jgi:Xaa-Pro aminopeptidase
MNVRIWRILLLAAALAAAPLRADPPEPAADTFSDRRSRLQSQLGEGLALVPSAPAGDHFRQDNDFWYLTGADWPDAVLALTKDGTWLFAKKPPPRPAGFADSLPLDKLDVAVSQYASAGLWVMGGQEEYYSAPLRPGEPGALENPFARSEAREAWGADLKKRFPEARVRGLQHRVARMRLIKDAGEVEAIRKSCEATGKSLLEAIGRVEAGMKEREFQRVLEEGYRERGAKFLSFPTIVGAGSNGTMVHYTANRETMDGNELVVVDTGAEVGMYASDVTRTFPADGKFTKRQRQVYEAVLEAQEAAIRAVKPGTNLMELDRVARSVLDERGFAGMMPHMTCHWVGLGVHDAGQYLSKLEPGMVLTVEPGVYLPTEGIGVRLEDVLVVTADGAENLTAWIPKTPDEIEALVGSARK